MISSLFTLIEFANLAYELNFGALLLILWMVYFDVFWSIWYSWFCRFGLVYLKLSFYFRSKSYFRSSSYFRLSSYFYLKLSSLLRTSPNIFVDSSSHNKNLHLWERLKKIVTFPTKAGGQRGLKKKHGLNTGFCITITLRHTYFWFLFLFFCTSGGGQALSGKFHYFYLILTRPLTN